jgi:predicted Zn-dependent protease
LTGRRRFLLKELAVVLAAAALLFAAALAVQRVFFSKPIKTPDVSLAIENALKASMLRQIRAEHKTAVDPKVKAAFAVIDRRLFPLLGNTPYRVEVIVVDSPVINALTLPGGAVVVYTGLIERMESADEMAAVIAHELGHVANRDPLTLLARQIGLSVLANVLTGGQGETVAQNALQTLVSMHYTHEAEDRADAFALEMLPRAGIPPTALADALTRLKNSDGKVPTAFMRYLDPHSPIDTRISRAERAPVPPGFHARALKVDWKGTIAALPKTLEPKD